jgi:uncharacterized protein YecE (DUF72 family)
MPPVSILVQFPESVDAKSPWRKLVLKALVKRVVQRVAALETRHASFYPHPKQKGPEEGSAEYEALKEIAKNYAGTLATV